VIGRVFRLVRTPLTLLALLAVLCYGAWWGYSNVLRPVPALPPEPCVNQTVPKGQLLSSQVVVSVYNGGTKKGLAGDVGRMLRERQFKVQRTTNTNEKIQKTVIVGAGAKNPEVLLVKGFFKDAQVRADKRPDHTVDVLVGNRYAGFNKNAATSLAVRTKTVCLPPTATATPTLGN
jgi:hypothetical protein